MCEDLRIQVKRLLNELQVTQAELARELTAQESYKVNPSELSSALNGLNTPKCRKVLTDALGLLLKEKMRQQALIDLAKRS